MTLAFALLLAATTSPASPAPDYPADAVLAAFATACSGAEDTAVNMASATAAGWERLADDSDTPVGRLTRAGKDAALKAASAGGDKIEMLPGADYRKAVAGRTLYLAVSSVKTGGITARGCRLFDFEAPRAFTAEELKQWSVREPGSAPVLAHAVQKIEYNPGLKPGHMSMEVFFIPAGVTPLPGFNLSGLSLVATALEF